MLGVTKTTVGQRIADRRLPAHGVAGWADEDDETTDILDEEGPADLKEAVEKD